MVEYSLIMVNCFAKYQLEAGVKIHGYLSVFGLFIHQIHISIKLDRHLINFLNRQFIG